MSEEIYRRLAQHLDALPNGFPPTESGSELRLLAKIFEPEEAALAAVMRLSREPADTIAARAGVDAKQAYQTLKTMARKGQIRAGRKDRQLVFGLLPFAVGFYEEQLPRMDREMAELFEAYYQESRGMAHWTPALQRVLPVEEAIPAGIEIYPYEQATQMLENAQSWGVRDCICRVQQRLIGHPCEHPVENCISFAPVPNAFDGNEVTRPITKEEALRILHEAEEAGLVHSPGNYQDGLFYICNCCTCACGVLRSVTEFGMPAAVARSSFLMVVDEDLCAGCGDCLDRCQFDALALVDGICQVSAVRCVGCGLCATVCPSGASHLVRRPEGEATAPPVDLGDWATQRAHARGLEGW